MAITTRSKLLTDSWIDDVGTAEAAVGRFNTASPVAKDCRVVFFEIAGDAQLHVNVIHQQPTITAAGWAGPARMPEGFVHNRRFGNTPARRMIRHIRDMVFAARTAT